MWTVDLRFLDIIHHFFSVCDLIFPLISGAHLSLCTSAALLSSQLAGSPANRRRNSPRGQRFPTALATEAPPIWPRRHLYGRLPGIATTPTLATAVTQYQQETQLAREGFTKHYKNQRALYGNRTTKEQRCRRVCTRRRITLAAPSRSEGRNAAPEIRDQHVHTRERRAHSVTLRTGRCWNPRGPAP